MARREGEGWVGSLNAGKYDSVANQEEQGRLHRETAAQAELLLREALEAMEPLDDQFETYKAALRRGGGEGVHEARRLQLRAELVDLLANIESRKPHVRSDHSINLQAMITTSRHVRMILGYANLPPHYVDKGWLPEKLNELISILEKYEQRIGRLRSEEDAHVADLRKQLAEQQRTEKKDEE